MTRGQGSGKREIVDVIVVGSGAGGLSAAVTAASRGLKVLVVEKLDKFGGTTARSGGGMWLPGNRVSEREGATGNSAADARTYLQATAGNHFDAERVDAFFENADRMVEFFERSTSLQFFSTPYYPDYHPERPGAGAGRVIFPRPFNGRELGKEIGRLQGPLRATTFLGIMIKPGEELLHFMNVFRSPRSLWFVTKKLAKQARDTVMHGRGMDLSNGNALAARLAKSAFDLGVEIRTGTAVKSLLREGGLVRGAVLNDRNGSYEVASSAVVLAAGGFPHDNERRKRFYKHAPTGREHHSPTSEGNTGDGISLAQSVGGKTSPELPNAAGWAPVSLVPMPGGRTLIFPHFVERQKPGLVAVMRDGRRFTNEANSYHSFCRAMIDATPAGEQTTAWLVADHAFVRRYGLGFAKPGPMPLFPYLRSGYLKRGATLQELAHAAGIDPAGLSNTITAYNAAARSGEDPQFGRGTNAYNTYLGDQTHKPNSCVAPLERGPFYAVQVFVGDLGTFAGLHVDRHARVLDGDGAAITGLYAAGNDVESIGGGDYFGPGATLGPAMTFGYIAGTHIAETNAVPAGMGPEPLPHRPEH